MGLFNNKKERAANKASAPSGPTTLDQAIYG